MSAALALSFENLVPVGGQQSCLAYWIGRCGVAGLRGVSAAGITHAMSYQYEVEDQADRTGVVLAQDVDWRDHFSPVAPVQLTQAWSPLPAAVDLLGEPDWISVEPDAVGPQAAACAWISAGLRQPPAPGTSEPDHERFRRLLAVTMMRAESTGQGVLIAAKPGWSYHDARMPGAIARQLMQRAGFVVSDRHA